MTRKLTAAPPTLPTLATIQPPLWLGSPVDETPEKPKEVTSPHAAGGGAGGGDCGSGPDGGAGSEGGEGGCAQILKPVS